MGIKLNEQPKFFTFISTKLNNHPVYIVDGDYTNLKITTMGDYKIAQAIESILREENK